MKTYRVTIAPLMGYEMDVRAKVDDAAEGHDFRDIITSFIRRGTDYVVYGCGNCQSVRIVVRK